MFPDFSIDDKSDKGLVHSELRGEAALCGSSSRVEGTNFDDFGGVEFRAVMCLTSRYTFRPSARAMTISTRYAFRLCA